MSSTPSGASENFIPERSPDQPTKVYSGGCHCGKFTFECRHPVLDTPEGFEVVSCNCSICSQRGYLAIYILDKSDFKLTKGAPEDLTRYKFNNNIVDHAFCPVCGCGILCETEQIIAINLRSVKGVDLDSLKLKMIDRRAV